MKFYTSEERGLKLKVAKFLGLIPTFVEVIGEKLVGGPFAPILNRVKEKAMINRFFLTLLYTVRMFHFYLVYRIFSNSMLAAG